MLLNCAYRPPNSPQSWIDEFEKQLLTAESTNMDLISIGDFNIDYSLTDQLKNKKWSKLVQDFGLHQLVTQPTRVTKPILDHIYTSCPAKIQNVSVSSVSMSDHFPIALTFSNKYSHCRSSKHKFIQYRSFAHFKAESRPFTHSS